MFCQVEIQNVNHENLEWIKHICSPSYKRAESYPLTSSNSQIVIHNNSFITFFVNCFFKILVVRLAVYPTKFESFISQETDLQIASERKLL